MIKELITRVTRQRETTYVDSLPAPIRDEVLAAMEATSIYDIP